MSAIVERRGGPRFSDMPAKNRCNFYALPYWGLKCSLFPFLSIKKWGIIIHSLWFIWFWMAFPQLGGVDGKSETRQSYVGKSADRDNRITKPNDHFEEGNQKNSINWDYYFNMNSVINKATFIGSYILNKNFSKPFLRHL